MSDKVLHTAAAARNPARAAGARGRRKVRWKKLVAVLILATVGYYVALIAAYRFIDPPASNRMLGDILAGIEVEQTWVPIDAVSPRLVHAVVASEDARFCEHWGVDWKEIERAVRKAGKRGPRGVSTISMQTAKNLFLWSDRSYLRKAIELPLTYVMELLWTKRRMIEIYLNIVEWAPGVYGIEAAAQHHFGTGAHRLSSYQAALLAASLPNPARRRAGRPGRTTQAHAYRIQKRMRQGQTAAACIFR